MSSPRLFFARLSLRAVAAGAVLFAGALFMVAQPIEEMNSLPQSFPRFEVPGHEEELEALRQIFLLHFEPEMKMGTLWDEWLPHSMIWPAVETGPGGRSEREHWRERLASRQMDGEGYVFTHQHPSIAHQHGWPFPFWRQGEAGGAWGWHFSLKNVPAGWHHTEEKSQEGWRLEGGRDGGLSEEGWTISITGADARIETPPLRIDPYQAPFLQLRWRAEGLEGAAPVVEWLREDDDGYAAERSFSIEAATDDGVTFTMIPLFRSPAWEGDVRRLRIRLHNREPGEVLLQALFTQYDTRHNVNNTKWIKGCARYFAWTRDLNFLRDQIQRLRKALHYMMVEHHGLSENLILTDWVGHEGRPGFTIEEDGEKNFHRGSGIGNNYWDLIPFGWKDTYATIHYYDALRTMADLEATVDEHPEWNIPRGPLRHSPEFLRAHAQEVKSTAGQLFWNDENGRFISNIDKDGKAYDYGLTFLNLEAIHYGFATPAQAERILAWVSGERIVRGDTSQGEDIYRWRFGPRATTLRNIDYYGWFWTGPESLPWGGQVQDGGAVLGFSYHDLAARLRVRGAGDPWGRLREIVEWFQEVREEGGYRAYYANGKRGTTLQGGGTAGGLGIDHEFKESVLLPQILLYDFLGFEPRPDGIVLRPNLPEEWPSLRIDRIRFHDLILDITASENSIRIDSEGTMAWPLQLWPGDSRWRVRYLDASGEIADEVELVPTAGAGIPVRLGDGRRMELERLARDGLSDG